MVKAEKAFKWAIAIIVIFGILNAFYFLNIVMGLKIALVILCVFMIGSILLQSGKGGGLAAIGGLGDQAAFGTRTSTFLSKVTYLIGAAFIVATIFLFKLSIPARNTMEPPSVQHSHKHPGQKGAHEHGGVSQKEETSGETAAVGMQTVEEKQPSQATAGGAPKQPETYSKPQHEQHGGMTPVEERKKETGPPEKPETGQ
ncbi:MAG TPA: preprotein translocase subunit SecG [Candidatus Brocadiaceae bacterium]